MSNFWDAVAQEAVSATSGLIDGAFAIGTVNPSHSSGRPKILFDGETSLTGITQTYPYLSSYTPVASHKVLLAKVGNTWVVLGRII